MQSLCNAMNIIIKHWKDNAVLNIHAIIKLVPGNFKQKERLTEQA